MVLSDESENGRGFRVLTSGIDLSRYEKNPVLLYMHRRGEVIGQVKDLRLVGGVLSGEPLFDCASELSVRVKKQYELGSVRACSMGIDILEFEPSGESLLEGVVPVVTKSSLYEVSMVDVPENANSVTLRWHGEPIGIASLVELSKSCVAVRPKSVVHGDVVVEKPDLLTNKDLSKMEMSEMALLLGLDAGASEEAVRSRLTELQSVRAELEKTSSELTALKSAQASAELSHVERLVDRAVREMRITVEKKPRYVELGKQIGSAALEEVLNDLPAVGKVSETLSRVGDGGDVVAALRWSKLSDVPSSELLALRKSAPRKYAELYKSEYGVEPELSGID